MALSANPSVIMIGPRESRAIDYRLVDARGTPVPDRPIRFFIVDNPATAEDEARGATISHARDATDADGRASLTVVAGQPATFRLRAAARGATELDATELDVTVIVSAPSHRSIEVLPTVARNGGSGAPITKVRLHFYEGTADGLTCSALSFESPPSGQRHPVRVLAIDTPSVYTHIGRDGNHAVLGVGLDETDRVAAAGCLDIPGASLAWHEPAGVPLPLHPLRANIRGRFRATSHIDFRPQLRGATAVAEAWGSLSECPRDPARLWLDCTIDALVDGGTADPLDCRPADEGALGARLLARRGMPMVGVGGGRCRGDLDAAGRISHDALADRLFPQPRPTLISSLSFLPGEAVQIFDAIRVTSTLSLARAPRLGDASAHDASHEINGVEFPLAIPPVTIDPREIAPPVIAATLVPADLKDGQLQIATHGFTIRIGTLALLALGRSSLRQRGAPQDVAGLIATVFNLATRVDGAATSAGCAALDTTLCLDVGQARGCLVAACIAGLSGLVRALEDSFKSMDGQDLDFFLSGTAPAIDLDADRKTDALGAKPPEGPQGAWSGEIRTRAGTSALSGTWTAEAIR